VDVEAAVLSQKASWRTLFVVQLVIDVDHFDLAFRDPGVDDGHCAKELQETLEELNLLDSDRARLACRMRMFAELFHEVSCHFISSACRSDVCHPFGYTLPDCRLDLIGGFATVLHGRGNGGSVPRGPVLFSPAL